MQSDEELMGACATWAAKKTIKAEPYLPWEDRRQIAWVNMLAHPPDPDRPFRAKKNYLCTRAIGGILDHIRKASSKYEHLRPYWEPLEDHEFYLQSRTEKPSDTEFWEWIDTLPELDRQVAIALGEGKPKEEIADLLPNATRAKVTAAEERIRRAIRVRRKIRPGNPG